MSDPGEKWEYGISIDWVGKAVEAVSGQTLDRYMQDNLLAPLGMTDTGFRIGDAQRQRLAKIHARTPDGLVSTDTEIPQEPEFQMGGGGLYATVGDYLKFAQMIMHGGTSERRAGAAAGDGGDHVAQRHGRTGLQSDEDRCCRERRTTSISLPA